MKPNPRVGVPKQPVIAVRRPRVVARRRKQSAPVRGVVTGLIGAFAVAVGGIYLYDNHVRSQAAQETAQAAPSTVATPAPAAEPAPRKEVASNVSTPGVATNDAAEALPVRAEEPPAPAPVEKPEPVAATMAAVKGTPAAPPAAAIPAKSSEPTATATDSDGYPMLPRFTLTSNAKAAELDRVRLLECARWAADTGKWQRHLAALQSAIGEAASQGSSVQYPANLQALVTLPTPFQAVEQAKFIRAVKPETLAGFSKEELNRDFLLWLFDRPVILAAFNKTIQPQDKAGNALSEWRTIWTDDVPNRDSLSGLAIACALVFDQPVRIDQNIFGFNTGGSRSSASEETAGNYNQKEVTGLSRYRFYRDAAKRGTLKVSLAEMMPWELVWVVDAPVPESELIWAEKHVNYTRHDWGKAYGHIRYRMDRATQGVNPYKAYTLEEIEKEGGICGDQAYFASITAKANGIPAMVIGGDGDRGAHAWFGYETARNNWNLSTGRYADNFAAGTTRDPQTGEVVKEHELRQRTDPARRLAGYDQSEKLLALGKLLKEANKPVPASLAIELALRASNKNYEAWVAHLDDLEATKAPAEDWLRESARARTAFKDFADLVQELEKREVAYATANGGSTAARQLLHTQAARMGRKDGERTDLILDSVFREADVAAKSGDIEGAGRIYRDALKDKGAEVVAFRQIAGRYYDWSKGAGQSPEAVRYIVSLFERKHEEPHGDTFAMGAYRGLLKNLSDMAKEQNLDTLQHRLDRREEKMDTEEKKLAKLQSKGADR